MATLNSNQRSSLEKTIIKARRLAEAGAIKALRNIAVENSEPFTHMDANQRKHRNQLRFKARLLGDELIDGKQNIDRLSYELAYEYWHRMLFARFLEANNLLIHPVHNVPVSFADCEEFAQEEGFPDKWTTAANYASYMLPAIFRPEDPLMKVEFATEDRLALEQLLEGIEGEIFTARDSLGWVYQYWQSEEKERVLASEEKINGEKLPAVTQIFTEPYMVHFLIDNTIGAWWVSRHPGEKPPVEFEYLRSLEDGTPAAGRFEGWPDAAKEITTLDPCMGSGHFIVELFNVLVSIRMREENLSKEESSKRVISDNLNGLEIDPRCTQIAAFNLALTAWKFNGKYIDLPELNLACCGISPRGKKEDWLKLVGKSSDQIQNNRLENGMIAIYDHFQLAPELGSLLDPVNIRADAFTASFDELQPVLKKALQNEEDKDLIVRGALALGISKVGFILSRTHHLILTNVPFLGANKMGTILYNYCQKYYKEENRDLATVFVKRISKLLASNNVYGIVTPQNWLSIVSFKTTRKAFLNSQTIKLIAGLGINSFRTQMYQFQVVLMFVINRKPISADDYALIDISSSSENELKSSLLKSENISFQNCINQLQNPDHRILINDVSLTKANEEYLSKYVHTSTGLQTFDKNRFNTYFWEVLNFNHFWELCQTSSNSDGYFGGCYDAIKWENGEGEFYRSIRLLEENGYKSGIWKAGTQFWGKKGISVSSIGKIRSNLYLGKAFDTNVGVVIPKKMEYLPVILAFLRSDEFILKLKSLDKKLMVTNRTIGKVSINFQSWKNIVGDFNLPLAFSNDSTQWLFHGNPKPSDNPLQVAISRLLGYQWPAETDEEIELAEEARQYINEIHGFDHIADEDGIVCIPSVKGEMPVAERLRDYIKEVWQRDWDNNTLSYLLKQASSKKINLEYWFREEFFEQHIKLFHNRPFIWQIWDGRKDGFSALVNYHKLDKSTLKKLIYTYLGDWIKQCELKVKDNESGADGLLMAAKKLKEQLLLIMDGEPPYDIFIRWKSLDQQPIGWEPDINDGVRLNIYPFMKAGVLRKNPNIKWEKDRGKNPPGTPWGPDRYNRYEDLEDKYKLKDEQGKIIAHLTNEIKRTPRHI